MDITAIVLTSSSLHRYNYSSTSNRHNANDTGYILRLQDIKLQWSIAFHLKQRSTIQTTNRAVPNYYKYIASMIYLETKLIFTSFIVPIYTYGKSYYWQKCLSDH